MTMGELLSKRFDEPDEVISHPKLKGQIVVLGETYVGRYVHQPGWRWSQDMRPLVGTPSCQYHHQGIVLSGYVQVMTDEGVERVIGPGEAFDIPPGHDASVIGEEPFVSIEFLGVRDWARPRTSGERVLATLLFTDIVSSTAIAARLGDAAWKQLLARHFDRVRSELDRFRGYEVKTTGDGFLALFDGTMRAVRCAAAICQTARKDGLEVRAGVHSGEIERYIDKVEGVAVHVAARIMALAGPGEVLLSAATVTLLEGARLSFIDAGEHKLKGLEGPRRLYRLMDDSEESGRAAG
jgi:class 3 adenylate cyclase